MRIQGTLFTLAVTTLLPVAASPANVQESTTKVRVDTSKRPQFANAPGRVWRVNPFVLKAGGGNAYSNGADGCLVADAVVDATDGGLRVFFVQVAPGPPMDGIPDISLVAFDEKGNRYPLKRDPVVSQLPDRNGKFAVWLTAFTLDPKVLVPDKAAYLGIEGVPAEPR